MEDYKKNGGKNNLPHTVKWQLPGHFVGSHDSSAGTRGTPYNGTKNILQGTVWDFDQEDLGLLGD